MKVCKTCKEELPLDNFEKARNECKPCRRSKRKQKHKVACKVCGVTFSTDKPKTLYCSHKCHGATRKTFVTVSCSFCDKDKNIVPSLYKRLENFYCDNKCRSEHLKVIMAGENNPNYNKQEVKCSGCSKSIKVSPHRLINHSFRFCSFTCYKENIGKYFRKENNHMWNGSISAEERIKTRNLTEYRDWRTFVYKRDKFTCRCCNDSTGGNLNAHHLDGWDKYPDKRFELSNGITLCETCHLAFHKAFGYGNNTKSQFDTFLSMISAPH
jgi:hypothetical protein